MMASKRIPATERVGQRFGRLVAVRVCDFRSGGHAFLECICDCGERVNVDLSHLVTGGTRSCGCLLKEHMAALGKQNTRHAMSNSREYNTWHGMLQRCNNKNYRFYKDYGGRGITVCEEWMKFENFYADMGDRPEGMSLDRIDNDGPYCKENCRWSTIDQQNNNRTNYCRFLMYRGEVRTASQWARAMGICLGTFWNRLKRGWSIEDALETPPGVKRGPRI